MTQTKTVFALSLALLLPLDTLGAVPTPEQVKASYQSSDAELLDRHGETIQSLRIDMTVRRLRWVALDEMSPSLPVAVLHAEDQRFYQHHGVDVEAIGKAAWDNLFRKRPRGASTITMQLASVLDQQLQPQQGTRSWGQKWDQIKAAHELDGTWTKQQILEAYLNLVSFRGELQGIGSASLRLFGKDPSGLNDVESVILASLIRAPNASAKAVGRRACELARQENLQRRAASSNRRWSAPSPARLY